MNAASTRSTASTRRCLGPGRRTSQPASDRGDDEPGDGDESGPRRSGRVDEVRTREDQRRGDVGGEHAEVQQARGVHRPRRQHQEQHHAARGGVVGLEGSGGTPAQSDGRPGGRGGFVHRARVVPVSTRRWPVRRLGRSRRSRISDPIRNDSTTIERWRSFDEHRTRHHPRRDPLRAGAGPPADRRASGSTSAAGGRSACCASAS